MKEKQIFAIEYKNWCTYINEIEHDCGLQLLLYISPKACNLRLRLETAHKALRLVDNKCPPMKYYSI